MNAKIRSSLELMRFGRSVWSALIVVPLSWRLDHYVVFLSFLLFSFAFNDLVDRKMDKDGHPERPLPSGRLTPIEAGLISATLLAIGSCFTYWWAHDLLELFVWGCSVSAIYSWILKRHVPLIATPIWALDVAVMVCSPSPRGALALLTLFLFLYIHEVLLDVRDAVADKIHCWTPSVAVLLGKYWGWYIYALICVFVVALQTQWMLGMAADLNQGSVPIRGMLMEQGSIALSIYACCEAWKNVEKAFENPLEAGITLVKRMFPLGGLL